MTAASESRRMHREAVDAAYTARQAARRGPQFGPGSPQYPLDLARSHWSHRHHDLLMAERSLRNARDFARAHARRSPTLRERDHDEQSVRRAATLVRAAATYAGTVIGERQAFRVLAQLRREYRQREAAK